MEEIRKALIIASDTFDEYPSLKAPVTEAIELAGLLRDPAVGDFAVQTLFNKSQREIGKAINSFFQNASLGDLLLLYFAGHGALDGDRRFYFVSRDSEREHLPYTAVNEEHVRRSMQDSRSNRKVLMVDCCYSGALINNILSRGDGMMDLKGKLASAGTVLLTASDAMEYAYEKKDVSGEIKSIYTSRIIEGLRSGEADRDRDGLISTEDLYDYALDRIRLEDSRQKPQRLAKANGLIILAKSIAAKEKKPPQETAEAELGNREASAPVASEAVISKRTLLDDGAVGKVAEIMLPGGTALKFCFCPPGSFMMGSPTSENDGRDNENQVSVTISAGFWLAQMPITQRQWKAVMGNNPSNFKGDELPVELVSWEVAEAFLKRANELQTTPGEWRFALPTEAQWEYACRAGTKTAFWFGDQLSSKEANFDGNYPYGGAAKGPYLKKTTPVGNYAANEWGLYGMALT